MQDKILLGLLLDRESLTGYETKKLMEISTSLFYTTSLGSIIPAYKKLEKLKAVTSKQKIENGRFKIAYSITEKGKKIFQNWMDNEIPIAKVKSEVLLKLFFFSQISKNKKKTLLNNYLKSLEEHLTAMNGIKNYCFENDVPKEQYDTLIFGIDYYKFLHDWFNKYKENL